MYAFKLIDGEKFKERFEGKATVHCVEIHHRKGLCFTMFTVKPLLKDTSEMQKPH